MSTDKGPEVVFAKKLPTSKELPSKTSSVPLWRRPLGFQPVIVSLTAELSKP